MLDSAKYSRLGGREKRWVTGLVLVHVLWFIVWNLRDRGLALAELTPVCHTTLLACWIVLGYLRWPSRLVGCLLLFLVFYVTLLTTARIPGSTPFWMYGLVIGEWFAGIGTAVAYRLAGRRLCIDRSPKRPLQFSLLQLILWMTAAALLTSVFQRLRIWSADWGGYHLPMTAVVAIAVALLSMLNWLALSSIFSAQRLWVSIPFGAFCALVWTAAALHSVNRLGDAESLILALIAYYSALCLSFLVLRWCGFRLVRTDG